MKQAMKLIITVLQWGLLLLNLFFIYIKIDTLNLNGFWYAPYKEGMGVLLEPLFYFIVFNFFNLILVFFKEGRTKMKIVFATSILYVISTFFSLEAVGLAPPIISILLLLFFWNPKKVK